MPAKSKPTAKPLDSFDDVLNRAGVKDRTNIQRYLTVTDAEPSPVHGQRWRELVRLMGSLAPTPLQTMSLETSGQHAVLFLIADGKYRMQVFALEDRKDGVLSVYIPDVLDAAAKAKLISKKGDQYLTAGKTPLKIDALSAATVADPPKHFKNMIGWNRKALRVTIDLADPADTMETVEALCRLGAEKFTPPAA